MASEGLLSLPSHLIDEILTSLEIVDLCCHVSLCCRSLHQQIGENEHIWSTFCSQKLLIADDGSLPFERLRRHHMRLSSYSRSVKWSRKRRGKAQPCARQGSAGSTLAIGDSSSFILFGGWTVRGMAKDVHILHAAHSSDGCHYAWSNIQLQIDQQSRQLGNGTRQATYGHTCTAIEPRSLGCGENEQLVLILGGVTYGGYRGAVGHANVIKVKVTNSTFSCNWEMPQRHKREMTPLPSCTERAYHSASYLPLSGNGSMPHISHAGKVWVFGGFSDEGMDGEGGAIDALQVLDLSQTDSLWSWSAPVVDGVPPCPRFGHSSTVVGGRLLIAGGSSGSSNFKGRIDGAELTDLHVLDTTSEDLLWVSVITTSALIRTPRPEADARVIPTTDSTDSGCSKGGGGRAGGACDGASRGSSSFSRLGAGAVGLMSRLLGAAAKTAASAVDFAAATKKSRSAPHLQRCHSAVALGSSSSGSMLLFFGGGVPGTVSNRLLWCKLSGDGAAATFLEEREGKVLGERPCARQNHSCGLLLGKGESKGGGKEGAVMVVYGGAMATSGSEELGDTHLLDIDFAHECLCRGVCERQMSEEDEDEGDGDGEETGQN